MGFRNGAYAKVWNYQLGTKADGSNGNFTTGSVTVSKKNKVTGAYEKDFQDGFVKFVGEAHNKIQSMKIPKNGLTIKIVNCDVTNRYSVKTKKIYISYTIFDFEVPDRSKNNSHSNSKDDAPDEDINNDNFAAIEEDLPFN